MESGRFQFTFKWKTKLKLSIIEVCIQVWLQLIGTLEFLEQVLKSSGFMQSWLHHIVPYSICCNRMTFLAQVYAVY